MVNSLSLNDFQGTQLGEILEPLSGQPVRVGILGVWTEAKVSYLAYELSTRYPEFQVGICSALTASASRTQHFVALEQMQKLLGIEVFASMGQFLEFLGFTGAGLSIAAQSSAKEIPLQCGEDIRLSDTDRQLLQFLFRDSRSVQLESLVGGFSGNLVLGARSQDSLGHEQAPHVVKIGKQELIGLERASFERIESILGNNAPRVTDFADFEGRGAIKYRYASMGGTFSTTLQKLYMEGLPLKRVRSLLDEVFQEQLGRFYAAATLEKCDLLDYYGFSPQWAPAVRQAVEAVLGEPATGDKLSFPSGRTFPNPCRFYEVELERMPPNRVDDAQFSYVHGDLNGANIIVDRNQNVWLIDFFHIHRGHVLKDLIKFENDLLYIFCKISGGEEFEEALKLSDVLLDQADLAALPPAWEELGLRSPNLRRAWETLRHLRSYYPALLGSNRHPLQMLIGQMRYAMHTLTFDESDIWQRRWALYMGAGCAQKIVDHVETTGPLHLGWIQEGKGTQERVGLTILPGRRDRNRDLDQDIQTLKKEGITHVVSLITEEEMADYGVPQLLEAFYQSGVQNLWMPILDQKVCSPEQMADAIKWMQEAVAGQGRVAIHCVGGLGRSGTLAACYLKTLGWSSEEALHEVRRARTARAVETRLQEEFVQRYSGS